MMIDPQLIAAHWHALALLAGVLIVGKTVGVTLGAMLAGTAAPLAVKDRIIVGASGGDNGVRDWIAALDAATGKLIWRKYTIPAPGEPGSESWKGTNNAWQTGKAIRSLELAG